MELDVLRRMMKILMISAVLSCYCVTESKGEPYLGLCFYNCEQHSNDSKYTNIYHEISDEIDLNE